MNSTSSTNSTNGSGAGGAGGTGDWYADNLYIYYIILFVVVPLVFLTFCLQCLLREQMRACVRNLRGRLRLLAIAPPEPEEGAEAAPDAGIPLQEGAERDDGSTVSIEVQGEGEEETNVDGATAGPSGQDAGVLPASDVRRLGFSSVLSRFCGSRPRPLPSRGRSLFMEFFDPDNSSRSIPEHIHAAHGRLIALLGRGGGLGAERAPMVSGQGDQQLGPVVYIPVPNNSTPGNIGEIYLRGMFGVPDSLLGMRTSGRLPRGPHVLYLPVFSSGDHTNSGEHFAGSALVLSELFECDDNGDPNTGLLHCLGLSGVIFCTQDSKKPGVDNSRLFQDKLRECSAARNAAVRAGGSRHNTLRLGRFFDSNAPLSPHTSMRLSRVLSGQYDIPGTPESQPGTPIFSPRGSMRFMQSVQRFRQSVIRVFSGSDVRPGTPSSQPGTPVVSPQQSVRPRRPSSSQRPSLLSVVPPVKGKKPASALNGAKAQSSESSPESRPERT